MMRDMPKTNGKPISVTFDETTYWPKNIPDVVPKSVREGITWTATVEMRHDSDEGFWAITSIDQDCVKLERGNKELIFEGKHAEPFHQKGYEVGDIVSLEANYN